MTKKNRYKPGHKKALFYLLLLFNHQLILAQESCGAWSSNDLSKKLIITQIDINVNNIFDTQKEKENRKFHTLANSWHTKTKDHIVIRELLFKTGDVFDFQLIAETERILRSKPFIKDAEVYPMMVCGNTVTIVVKTKDNWTLNPGISFGTSGGKNKYSLELQEKNLLGFGKSLEFKYRKGLERNQKSISYRDPNLFGSKKQMEISYQNNSDGRLYYFDLIEPFIALDTKYSWQAQYLDWELVNPIYDRGEIVDEIGQIKKNYSLSYGALIKKIPGEVHRINIGYTSDQNSFFNSKNYPLSQIPQTRNYKYPWISYAYFKELYIKRTNFNSMGRQEDISLGHHLVAKIGRSSNDSSLHYDLSYKKGFYPNENNLFFLSSYFNGIYDNNKQLNSHLGLSFQWYTFQSSNKSFYLSSTLEKGNNLFPENPQYLGGETGLRGYPFRYLSGENKFISSIEQRYFYDWYPLRTFQFASAIFIDTGAVWDNDFKQNHLTNIGFGFRLVPTRTSGGQVIHLDFAIPLNHRDLVDGFQIQIRAKRSF